jgi:LPXTG-site transpeptidase (sortase) family protein
MAFKLKYRLAAKFDEIILNKKVMVVVAVFAPIVFAFGVFCLEQLAENDISLPRININKGQILGLFSKSKDKKGSIKIEMPAHSTQSTSTEKDSVFSHNLSPIYSDATKLTIDSVKINISLMDVSVNDDGVLQVPTNWTDGGWFKYSARPGEQGNVIINAHYDDNFGRPAAFWQLKNVKVGDKVLLLDKYGKSYTYSVTDSYLVSINDPNRLKVFADEENKATLTLLTCGGIWLPGKSTYDKRFIVKAELVK